MCFIPSPRVSIYLYPGLYKENLAELQNNYCFLQYGRCFNRCFLDTANCILPISIVTDRRSISAPNIRLSVYKLNFAQSYINIQY